MTPSRLTARESRRARAATRRLLGPPLRLLRLRRRPPPRRRGRRRGPPRPHHLLPPGRRATRRVPEPRRARRVSPAGLRQTRARRHRAEAAPRVLSSALDPAPCQRAGLVFLTLSNLLLTVRRAVS